jgi:hypothetical protein
VETGNDKTLAEKITIKLIKIIKKKDKADIA